jgi:protein involved in polysaccharide export with SLBB domain
MHNDFPLLTRRIPCGRRRVGLWLLGMALLCVPASGCASFTNPVADGIRVRQLPPEFFVRPKEELKPIPLSLLRQQPPEVYRLDSGDLLGVWVEGVLGKNNEPPPIAGSETVLGGLKTTALGFPIPVRTDGTITLPLIPPLHVEGMTLVEAQEALRVEYTVKRQLLPKGKENIIVTLIRPREYQVLVIREDGGGSSTTAPTALPSLSVGSFALNSPTPAAARGTGAVIGLPAYENDVLNALARTGGLPGLDAANEVIIQRGGFKPGKEKPAFDGHSANVIRIPLRLSQGEDVPFRPQDIILNNGDVVLIQARPYERYYTGGLLGGGEYILPRDHDLDVVQAVARVRGPLVNGGLNQNNFTGQITTSGLGNPNPSQLTVLRKTGAHGQVQIKVDLNRALSDPRERILVQAGDVLILQETLGESFTRYWTTVIRFEYLYRFYNNVHTNASSSGIGP